jgi:hypothetical protein
MHTEDDDAPIDIIDSARFSDTGNAVQRQVSLRRFAYRSSSFTHQSHTFESSRPPRHHPRGAKLFSDFHSDFRSCSYDSNPPWSRCPRLMPRPWIQSRVLAYPLYIPRLAYLDPFLRPHLQLSSPLYSEIYAPILFPTSWNQDPGQPSVRCCTVVALGLSLYYQT